MCAAAEVRVEIESARLDQTIRVTIVGRKGGGRTKKEKSGVLRRTAHFQGR